MRSIMVWGVTGFLSKREESVPCGIFSFGHFILLGISLVLLWHLLYLSRNITEKQVEKITKRLAVGLTGAEVLKIFFNFYSGYIWLDAWLPVSYCSIFLYALWLSGYGQGVVKEVGQSYLAGGMIIAGIAFLLFPSTSLTQYPANHFLSLHSMCYHTLMIYIGLEYLIKMKIHLNRKTFFQYAGIVLGIISISITINTICNVNLMIIREPYCIPLPFLHKLQKETPWGYTGLVAVVYLVFPFWTSCKMEHWLKKNEILILRYSRKINRRKRVWQQKKKDLCKRRLY